MCAGVGPEGRGQVSPSWKGVKICWVKAKSFQLTISKGGPVPYAQVSLPAALWLTCFPALKPFLRPGYFEAGKYIPWAWSSAPSYFPSATEPECVGSGSVGMVTFFTFFFFNRWELQDFSVYLLHYAAAHFAPCPPSVSANTGSKRLKGREKAESTRYRCVDGEI